MFLFSQGTKIFFEIYIIQALQRTKAFYIPSYLNLKNDVLLDARSIGRGRERNAHIYRIVAERQNFHRLSLLIAPLCQ